MVVLFKYTDVPAYSDTLGTRQKCHFKQIVTLSRGGLVSTKSFGTCLKCHCKLGVTVNSVTVTGEICTIPWRNQLPVCQISVLLNEFACQFYLFVGVHEKSVSRICKLEERPLIRVTGVTHIS